MTCDKKKLVSAQHSGVLDHVAFISGHTVRHALSALAVFTGMTLLYNLRSGGTAIVYSLIRRKKG